MIAEYAVAQHTHSSPCVLDVRLNKCWIPFEWSKTKRHPEQQMFYAEDAVLPALEKKLKNKKSMYKAETV